MGHIEETRAKQVFSKVPQIKQPLNTLYVGASRTRCHLVDKLTSCGHKLTLLEVFPLNAKHYENDHRFDKVVCGDVRNIKDHFSQPFDLIMWWHGPEHVARHELDIVLEAIESCAHIVILGAPWGKQKQGPVYGNEHEKHLSALYERDLQDLGYNTATIGEKDRRGSNLLAWKILS